MRKLTNALVAGQLAALLAAELVLILNPEVPHTPGNVLSVWGVFAISHGLAGAAGLWILLLLIESVRGRALGPAWLSFRILTWLFTLALGVSAALFWINLVSLRLYVPSETVRTLALAATVVSTAAGALLVMGFFHYSFGRRGSIVSYSLSGGSLIAAVALPLILRPQPISANNFPRMPLQDTPSLRRITLIGFEGASLSYVLPAVAEGKLPNFARLIEGGASGALRTLYPTESLAVWTSVATGKLPRQHGLKGFYRYRFPSVETPFSLRPRWLDFRSLDRLGIVRRSAVTSSLRRTQPFWSILSRFGVKVGLLRWWGSYPADPVDGFVISEYFHRQVRERLDPPLPGLTSPESLFERMSPQVVFPDQIDGEVLSGFVDTTIAVPGDDFPWKTELTRALADDMTYHRIGKMLREEYEPDVFATYYFGLDIVGHYFTRFHRPARFGDVSDAEKRKYGRVVDAYYRYLDTILGESLQARSSNEIFIVLSGHGMDPLPLTRRIVEPFKGNLHLSGYHEASPDGLLILNGPGIAQGTKIQSASVLDITPTLLYLLGLPLGQDMDGTLLTEIFADELVLNQPVTFISSYHNFLIEPRRDDVIEASSPLDALPELLVNPQ
ncbi:MAG TPA: alkaline phosphatase family protein [Vicinamibacteria bacterium]|nr:alkaline phosphatase family protein [Vicinamibacteria bacterium]